MIVAAGGIVDRVVGFGVNEVLDGIGQWVGRGASEMLTQAGNALSASTRPELGKPWFAQHFADMTRVAALVVLPMLFVSIIRAIVRQDLSVLLRSALVHLPLAALLTAVAVELVQLSLAATDMMCTYVSRSTGGAAQAVVSSVAGALDRTALAVGQPAVASFALFMSGVVIYVAVLFLPLALATLVWPSVSHWCRRLAETLAALVLSKLVVVATLSLAAGALAGHDGSADLSGVVSGAALLLLAALSPYALLRLIPAVEAGAVMHLEGASRRASSFAVESGSSLPLPSFGGSAGDEPLTVSVGQVEGEPGLGSTFVGAGAVAASGGAAAAVGGASAAAEGAGGTAGGAGAAAGGTGAASRVELLRQPLPPPPHSDRGDDAGPGDER